MPPLTITNMTILVSVRKLLLMKYLTLISLLFTIVIWTLMASLIFSMTKSILFVRYMYLIRGFPRSSLKYPANLGLLKKSLLKWSIGINYIPNYLKVNNQILTFIISIRNLERGLLKIWKIVKPHILINIFL